MSYRQEYIHSTKRLTSAELRAVIEPSNFDKRKTGGRRDFAIVRFQYVTGARCCEVSRLRFRHVEDFNGKLVLRLEGKGKRERVLVLGEDVRAFFDQFLAKHPNKRRRRGDDPIFFALTKTGKPMIDTPITRGAIYQVYRRLGERVGVALHPHRMRHSKLSELADAGVDLWSLMGFAGHSQAATTMRYLSLSIEKLAAVTSAGASF